MDFVPADFDVPTELITPRFRLEPLGPEHNVSDHAAWTGSIDHVRATPGFQGSWPPADGMSLERNLADLQRHADDFAGRRGFTFTVLEPGTGEVIGCVYIYPSRQDERITDVRSWVRGDRAALDKPLYDAVHNWLTTDWPFESIDYASRSPEPPQDPSRS
ncbi:GNAT family N-acetyltransferase [Kribbella sp. NPDC004138]